MLEDLLLHVLLLLYFCNKDFVQLITALFILQGAKWRFLDCTLQIKKKQQKIEMILSSKKYPFEKVDIAADQSYKEKMRQIVGNDRALPPQLCKGSTYIGVSFSTFVTIFCKHFL